MTATLHYCAEQVMRGRVHDQHVLFNLEDRQLHVLNETGETCWHLLASAPTLDHLVELVARQYDAATNEIRPDVIAIVEAFRKAELVVTRAPFPVVDVRDHCSASVSVETLTVSRRTSPTTIGPFFALTVPVLINVEDLELRADLERVFAPLVDSSSPGQRAVRDVLIDVVVRQEHDHWMVSVNGKTPQRFTSRAAVIRSVVATVNAKPLDYIDDMVIFHAAAAEFDDGITMFPGISNAGKSTLVTQLIHRGHGYVSDEAIAIKVRSHDALPFPKSIAMNPGSEALSASLIDAPTNGLDVDPRSIGPGKISNGGQVRRVVFPEYQPGAKTVLERLDPFQAFKRLLHNSFRFDRAHQAAFDTIVSLANEVPAYSLVHSGSEDHLELIEQLGQLRQGATN